MKTIAFLGDPSPQFTLFNWRINAEELGFSAKLNDIGGLTKDDIIIIDKMTDIDFSSSPAKVVLYYPDVVMTERHQSEYLRKRALALCVLAEDADLALSLAVHGGEDYELVLIASEPPPLAVYRIGEVIGDSAGVLWGKGGEVFHKPPIAGPTFTHFASDES